MYVTYAANIHLTGAVSPARLVWRGPQAGMCFLVVGDGLCIHADSPEHLAVVLEGWAAFVREQAGGGEVTS